ncbi:hypothetical protein S83_020293 [Arachis hypogaea]
MARKKRAVRKGSHSVAHSSCSQPSTPISLNTESSPSPYPTNSPPTSPQNNSLEIACTKTTARRPGVTPRLTSTLPNVSQLSSSQLTSSRGKRPLCEEDEELASSHARHSRIKRTTTKCHNIDEGTEVSSHDEDSLIFTSNSSKIRVLTGIMKNVLQEFFNLTNFLINYGVERKRNEVMEENALKKTKGGIQILRDYVEDIEAGLTTTDNEDDDEAFEDSNSDA